MGEAIDREEAFRRAEGELRLEGIVVSAHDVPECRAVLEGTMTHEEARRAIIARHTVPAAAKNKTGPR